MLDQQPKMQSVVMNQQAQAPAAGNLQFMDASSYGSSTGYGGGGGGGAGYSGPGGAGYYQHDYSGQIGGAVDFDNEPPLLEELGIDFDKIVKKTISVLDPTRKVTREMMYSTSIHTGGSVSHRCWHRCCWHRCCWLFRALGVEKERFESWHERESR